MTITAGMDVGSSAVKTVIVKHQEGAEPLILFKRADRIRRRDILSVVHESFEIALDTVKKRREDIDYIATTGEGELVDFRTGHFYGMTAHARGAIALDPDARAALDMGALHARAMVIDARGRVLGYRMTSQCASGSGQFIENISRYLGVALEEVGSLSKTSQNPEKCSSICAVLAETDVINMVSRGIGIANILKGIHVSMASRFVKLLQASGAKGKVVLTGGLAADIGLQAALAEEAERSKLAVQFTASDDSVFAGALGAAIWADYRLKKLKAMNLQEQVSVNLYSSQ